MKIHVTFDADDLINLQFTGNTSGATGRQYMTQGKDRESRPSFYAEGAELRQIADHFDQLATEAGYPPHWRIEVGL